ncbi:hypothetical protein R9C00_04905 [Flammeovirgaceae bacterium SG7u.111]|nr:hypothetical protein [Flammeovirgaceae bacterium SG7u.132]WPO36783.1 hypothetical protein R9C00_04905 [Flammeovirgaceae bacterium SG7u.111]
MKKYFFTLITLCLFAGMSNAQSNWEIGGRLGGGGWAPGNHSNNFSIDMTIPFKAPRLHAALYLDNDIAAGVYFDWMFILNKGPKGLKFYPGVGPELYFYDGVDLAVAGDFGVEYSFDFPLTVGVDWRPNFMLTDNMNYSSGNWGILARFRIGEGISFVRSK